MSYDQLMSRFAFGLTRNAYVPVMLVLICPFSKRVTIGLLAAYVAIEIVSQLFKWLVIHYNGGLTHGEKTRALRLIAYVDK